MLTCKHWDKFIDDYLAGRLGPVKRFIFRVHFILCPPCKRYLDEYRRTLEVAHAQGSRQEQVTPLSPALAEAIAKKACERHEGHSHG